jgi:hypothetical protein
MSGKIFQQLASIKSEIGAGLVRSIVNPANNLAKISPGYIGKLASSSSLVGTSSQFFIVSKSKEADKQ